jgi:hypothetical protein
MTLHPYDQHDWRKESLTCDLDELEHVLQAHIENDVAIEAVLRLSPQTVAEILLSLRADMHREQVQSMEEWEEQERTIAWLRKAEFKKLYKPHPSSPIFIMAEEVGQHLASSPPPEWKTPHDNS